MMQRECGPIPDDFCLWRRVESNGRTEYRPGLETYALLTLSLQISTRRYRRSVRLRKGRKRRRDPLRRNGDGQIAFHSLSCRKDTGQQRGLDWGRPRLADHPNPKRRMRATLIVVSSARKLNFIFKDEITSTVLINEWINEMKL